MISNSEGKFHYLLVRELSAIVYGRTKHDGYTHVCPYSLTIASRWRVCLQLTYRIPPSTQSRRWSTHHRTIRRKISKSFKL